MKTLINETDVKSIVTDLDRDELQVFNGGGLAYDLGFFLRECVISLANGAGTAATAMVILDVKLNYKPLN